MKILIVEAHNDMRAALRQWFAISFPRYEVLETADVREACPIAQAQAPRVVIIDADSVWREAIISVREIKRAASDVTVVLLGSLEEPRYYADAQAVGAAAYVPKWNLHEEFLTMLSALDF